MLKLFIAGNCFLDNQHVYTYNENVTATNYK